MKNLPLKLIILFLTVLFLAALGMLFFAKKPNQPTSTLSSPNPQATPILKKQPIDFWLKSIDDSHYSLMTKSPVSDQFDTVQLVFKNLKAAFKFTSSPSSKFILRINLVKNEETILLLSTDGKLSSLPEKLGELSFSKKITTLTTDLIRSKVIKGGEDFPINFLGIKND